MNTHYRYEDGTKVPDGVAIRALAQRTILKIEIDSMGYVSPSAIMAHLKQRWGVNEVAIESVTVTCKGGTTNVPVPRI